VNESRALEGLVLIAGKGRLADTVGRFLAQRLDESGVGESPQAPQWRQNMRNHEVGQPHVVIGEHFLGQRLVFAQMQRVGSGAGIAHFHQLQQCRMFPSYERS